MRHAVEDYEHSAPLVQVLDVPVPQMMVIRQRTVGGMLQDLVDGVQLHVEALEEKLAVPQPVPPDRTQQRFVEQLGIPVLALVLM